MDIYRNDKNKGNRRQLGSLPILPKQLKQIEDTTLHSAQFHSMYIGWCLYLLPPTPAIQGPTKPNLGWSVASRQLLKAGDKPAVLG